MITSTIRSIVGTTLTLSLFSEMSISHQMPVAWLIVACAALTVLGGLGNYFKERGEKKWSTKGVITTITLMATIGVSCGAGLSVVCEMYGIPNLLVVMVCGLIGVFGIDVIEKLPDIAPIMRALKAAVKTFSKGDDDEEKEE